MSKRIRFDNPSHLTKALLYISFEFYGPYIAFAFPFFLRQDVKCDLVFLILQLREEGFIFLTTTFYGFLCGGKFWNTFLSSILREGEYINMPVYNLT